MIGRKLRNVNRVSDNQFTHMLGRSTMKVRLIEKRHIWFLSNLKRQMTVLKEEKFSKVLEKKGVKMTYAKQIKQIYHDIITCA